MFQVSEEDLQSQEHVVLISDFKAQISAALVYSQQ